MPLPLLADENLRRAVVIQLREAYGLDVLTAQEAGFTSHADARILAAPAEIGRVVVTHDIATMPSFAYERVSSGKPMPGLLVIPWNTEVGVAIQAVALVAIASLPRELDGRVVYLPLR